MILTLLVVTGFLILILLVLHAINKANEQKEQQERLRIKAIIDNTKLELKITLNELIKLKLVNKNTVSRLLSIAGNYFIFYKVTEESLTHYSSPIGDLINMLILYKNHSVMAEGKISARGILKELSSKLPTSNTGFNQSFYSEELPNMIKLYSTDTFVVVN